MGASVTVVHSSELLNIIVVTLYILRGADSLFLFAQMPVPQFRPHKRMYAALSPVVNSSFLAHDTCIVIYHLITKIASHFSIHCRPGYWNPSVRAVARRRRIHCQPRLNVSPAILLHDQMIQKMTRSIDHSRLRDQGPSSSCLNTLSLHGFCNAKVIHAFF